MFAIMKRLGVALCLAISALAGSGIALAADSDKAGNLPDVPVALLIPLVGSGIYAARWLRAGRHTRGED